MANEAAHLYGVHDWDQAWAALVQSAAKTAWCVVTLEVGDDPNNQSGQDFSHISNQGIAVIGRLNYSHHGQGTIPVEDKYDEFAIRCRNFVAASKGCTFWTIGNEPNLAGERPAGTVIMPNDYAKCFKLCRSAIKSVGPQHQVMTAGIAPYNVDTYAWVPYFRDVMESVQVNGGADGIGLHTYSRGGGPQSVYSEEKMLFPYDGYYNGFRAYRDFLAVVPQGMRGLPVYITETDQNVPWVDANSGWVRAAYGEIDWWNRQTGSQKIHCLVLYRWSTDDKWNFSQKRGVVDDFYETLVSTDYRWPAVSTVPPVTISGARLTITAPAGAQVRKGPGVMYTPLGAVAYGGTYKVVGRNGDASWWQSVTSYGKGWISGSIVKVEDVAGVPIVLVTVPITTPQSLGKDWLISAWSRILGVDERLVKAVLAIESGGRSFEGDRMIVRFENHVFLDQLRKLAPSLQGVYRNHFKHGSPSHTGHEYRVNDSGPWEKQHDGGQAEEWAVFNYAKSIHPEAAMKAISMGSAQVMGFNHKTVGYPTVQAMFDDFNSPTVGEYNQLAGFFAYIVNRDGLLQAARRRDWATIAEAYNGTGGISYYAPALRQKYIELGGSD